MLRDVTHRVTDGLLGFATEKGDGVHAKIGASPVTSGEPVVITGSMDAAKIKDRLGLSPLADAVMDSVQFGANRIYCIPVAASTPGTVGAVVRTGEGGGTVSVSGSPANAFAVKVKITVSGGLNTAAFAVSLDGGSTFSDEITVADTYTLPGTGLTLTFTAADGAAFAAGDTFTFAATAPVMTNGDVLAAVDQLKDLSAEIEFVHIVGASVLPLWQAVGECQLELRDVYKKPLFFVLEAAAPAEDKDLTDWALGMETARRQINNYDLQVVAAWGELVRLDGSAALVNLAGVVSGFYARAAVQTSIGKTRPEAGFGVSQTKLSGLLPADSAVIELLDNAGYLTLRRYDGLADSYVYHAKMLAPDGSDFRYAEDVRVKNKIIRETRKEGLLLLGDDIDLEDVQGELETRARFLFTPLRTMIDAGEISSAEITVPEGQEQAILEDGLMRVNIRYVSRGYIREIEVDLGRTAPGEQEV